MSDTPRSVRYSKIRVLSYLSATANTPGSGYCTLVSRMTDTPGSGYQLGIVGGQYSGNQVSYHLRPSLRDPDITLGIACGQYSGIQVSDYCTYQILVDPVRYGIRYVCLKEHFVRIQNHRNSITSCDYILVYFRN